MARSINVIIDEVGMKGIAVIGLSGRFPGASDIYQFWKNLCDEKETISFFSDVELRRAGVSSQHLNRPNYVRAAPILDGVDQFDREFFNLSKQEAELMDPQQRIMLECAWEAFETAGYSPESMDVPVGVFASAGGSVISYLLECYRVFPELHGSTTSLFHTGTDKDFLATRISYKLNLKGPSVVVQSACSSSLVSVHMAIQSILSGECGMALAGGVNIRVPQIEGYVKRVDDVLSVDGHCRAFDASASGAVFGSGAGLVLLKDLDRALADGDKIFAIIRGSSINNDGNEKLSYSASSIRGQSACIDAALRVADINPETIGYMEAHGAGTAMGDPIEIAAMSLSYKKWTSKKQYCAIGSVKNNVGHLDTAAGVVGLIKAVLALHYSKIPAHINYQNSNPKINFLESPFYVCDKTIDWINHAEVRRAAVNSLGIGGTNAHVILEEAPARETCRETFDQELFVLSAKTQTALREMIERHVEYLHQNPSALLRNVCATACGSRAYFEYRVAILANSLIDLKMKLTAIMGGSEVDDVAYSRKHRHLSRERSHDGAGRLTRSEALRLVFGILRDGGAVDLGALGYTAGKYEKVSLPLYPFQRKRYWVPSELVDQKEKLSSVVQRIVSESERIKFIKEFLKKEVTKMLPLNVVDIDVEESFLSLGMDSVMAVEFRNSLVAEFGFENQKEFPTVVAFNYSTISVLAQFIESILVPREDLKTPYSTLSEEADDGIAIVGIGCRFPGGVKSPGDFWTMLTSGNSAVSAIPETRFDIGRYYSDDIDELGKTYVRHGGFLADIDQFDPAFFGVSPKEALALDPQQRLLLEASWEAIEQQGDPYNRLMGSKTSVFVGAMYQDYAEQLFDSPFADQLEVHTPTGAMSAALAGRLSYFYDFKGEAVTIDTACSSSLVAVHLACQSLRDKSCERAIAAGVNVILSHKGYVAMSRSGALSKEGRCATFDESADGYVRSEGCGVLVLKRLSEARASGNRILAIIRGSSVNQDGRSASFTAPSSLAQQEVIQAALNAAQVLPSDIGYVEAHGTGTPLGDPIELGAIDKVFRESTNLVVGSVKTNIGHTEAAAGIAGIIKVVLSMSHNLIPKHLHYRQMNSKIELQNQNIRIPVDSIPWPRLPHRLRIAGVSSFGLSGTNAHVVVQESPDNNKVSQLVTSDLEYVFVLSAISDEALKELVCKYVEYMRTSTDALRDICATTCVGRAHFKYRIALVVSAAGDLYEKLLSVQLSEKSLGIYRGIAELEVLRQVDYASKHDIAMAYVSGATIEWGRVWGDFDRVDLPKYAFQKQTYWIKRGGNQEIWGHAFLGRRLFLSCNSDSSVFERLFDVQEIEFLNGHKVFEKIVVPGATYLEMAMAAARATDAIEVILEKVEIEAPLILSEGHPRWVQTVLGEQDGIKTFKILSRDIASERWTTHAVGRVKPVGKGDLKFAGINRSVSLESRRLPQIDTVKFYEGIRQRGFDYSGKYLGAAEIYRTSSEVYARVRLPQTRNELILAAGEDCMFHPALLDCCLHVGFAAEELAQGPLLLPIGLERYICARKARGELWSHVSFREKEQGHDEKVRIADIQIFDEDGVFAQILGLICREVSPQSLRAREGSPAFMYEVQWEPQSTVLVTDVSNLDMNHWMLISPQAVVGLGLDQKIRAVEKSSVVSQLTTGDADFDRKFSAEIHMKRDRLARLRIVWSALTSGQAGRVKHAENILSLIRLINLIRAQKVTDVELFILTDCAQPVGEQPRRINFWQAALLGLGRIFAAEEPGVGVGLIDIDMMGADWNQVYREIVYGINGAEVALRAQGRWVRRLMKSKSALLGRDRKPISVDSKATYVITGGFGGLGLVYADALVGRGVRNLILIGRSGPNESSVKLLCGLKKMGANICEVLADVSDMDSLQRGLSGAGLERMPPIKGVVHCAGAYEVTQFQELTYEKFESVVGAKVLGAMNIHRITSDLQLDFFTLISSSSSLIGYPGQAGYAAGNAIIDSFAYYLRSKKIPVKVIQWGPLAGLGMLKTYTKREIEMMIHDGENAIQKDEVISMIDQHFDFSPSATECAILKVDWAKLRGSVAWDRNRTFFGYLYSHQEIYRSNEFWDRLIKAPNHGQREVVIIDFLETEARRVLGVAEPIDPDTNLMSLGMDSLMSVDFKNQLAKHLGPNLAKEMPVALVFSYPTLNLIKDYMMKTEVLKSMFGSLSGQQVYAQNLPIVANKIGLSREDRMAYEWATASENAQDPRAIEVLTAIIDKLRMTLDGV